MDENIVRILASYGCKYMADDNKEMIEEIEAYVKKREEQLHIPFVSQRSELLKVEDKDVPFDYYVKKYFKEPKMELIYRSKKNGGMMTEKQLINYYKRAMCL